MTDSDKDELKEKDSMGKDFGDGEEGLSSSPSLFRTLAFFSIPLVIVCVIGVVFFAFRQNEPLVGSEAAEESKGVEIGKDYYVAVSVVEVAPNDLDGDAWDQVDASAPDLMVEIHWRGQRVYRSSVKEDSFVAKWSNAQLNLREIALTGKKTSVDEMIQGARINVKNDEQVEIRVFDEDLLGSREDIGSLSLETSSLLLGDSSFEVPESAVKRLVLRVMDMSQTPDIFQ